ncbi:hypothetical protein KK062_15460 [Fulvivirgaceae bacterium PWU5]|uniref:Uncharacterized protein n=1 Tax=Dawidia cretensis TaxID=2782350 RepID=A0AAP2DXU8_9BACT|nr:hypothetical protein [Dawidia cretensis]MBT1709640.1 hypothetical protein [Dawidia cretensis]
MSKTKTLNTTDSTRDINDTRPAMKKPTKKIAATLSNTKSTITRHGSTKRKG